jgi:flagellar biosynthesis/type III secretory pathway chaperone
MLEPVNEKALEALFYKKIMLYHDLRDCLKKEREHLIQMDLNSLWEISRCKESLCTKLKSARQEFLKVLHRRESQGLPQLVEMIEDISEEKTTVFQGLYHRLSKLKSDVEAFRKENVHYVDDSLQFIDEIIAIIAGESHGRNIYDRRCQLKKAGDCQLLMREV